MKWLKCDAAFPQILGRGERDSSRMAAINLGVLAGVLLCAREEVGDEEPGMVTLQKPST